MLARLTTLLAPFASLVSVNAVPAADAKSLGPRQECTGVPSVTLRASEWTRVEGLAGDQGGFGGDDVSWRLAIAEGTYSEEQFTLITYQVGGGGWSDAVSSPQGLQEDKRFHCTITAPNGVSPSDGCGIFTVTYTFPIVPTYLNGGIEAVCTKV